MATKLGVELNAEVASLSRDRSPYKSTEDLTLNQLIRKRGILKGRFTKFHNYLLTLCADNLTNVQIIDINLRIQNAVTLFSEFNVIQSQIEESVADVDLDGQLEHRELFESNYFKTLALAQSMCSNVAISNENTSEVNHSTIKLPTIIMPTFSGEYDQWLEFRDTFTSLVHNSREISNIQKYHYLKSSLKGSAELVIDSLEFSSNNYPIAWELLLNRYDNHRLLIFNHVKSLFSLKSISNESSSLIRNLIDTVLKNLRALKILGEPTDSWDTLIIYLVVSKLDQTSEREWEQYKINLFADNADTRSPVKLDHLLKFLRDRADMLDTLSVSTNKLNITRSKLKAYCNVSSDKPRSRDYTVKNCLACNANHPLYLCEKFINLDLNSKLSFIKRNSLCINCLRAGHSVAKCRFGSCKKCDKKHNTIIHNDYVNTATSHSSQMHSTRMQACSAAPAPSDGGCVDESSQPIHVNEAHVHSDLRCVRTMNVAQHVLLSTALIEVADISGTYITARALLDNGSQRCFITKSLCDSLNIPLVQSTMEIRGVGNSVTQATEVCEIDIKSRADPSYATRLNCFVLSKITSSLPAVSNLCAQLIPKEIQLADPYIYESRDVDILIGADRFWDLLKSKIIRLPAGPVLYDTHLGWIISGQVNLRNTIRGDSIHCNLTQSLEMQLRRFWELEELPKTGADTRTEEERACEKHFVATTRRKVDGRFCVRIPFKGSPDRLGDTYSIAERRFKALERRLERNPHYKALYVNFMKEYADLGHMSLVRSYGTPHYFMPHHGVFREHSTTTKLRVVFDASADSTTDVSLNELQMIGPPIQGDLMAILLRFRQYKYTACADIEKMYRQCLVDETQRDLQLILWRDDSSKPLDVYRLNTVTYGTASAPFLSCRSLKQLGYDCDDPDIKRTILDDFYVDDMITGHDDKNQLLQICEKITGTLQSGCFPLRKWLFNFNCNNAKFLDSNSSHVTSKPFHLDESASTKTLGLGWCNIRDTFYFDTQFKHTSQIITKRYIMSIISQIFDPLGLLSCATVTAKVLLQRLWLLKTGWDDELPSDVRHTWQAFVGSLPTLRALRIPRHVIGDNPIYVELHVFTDASESAYGACVYVRTVNADSTVACNLLCSKSKVAPLKPVSVPRLELCGALVGARLYDKVRDSLRCHIRNVIFWCDSTIVLGWLRMAPNALKPFVQNRVAEIHDLTKGSLWRHIRSKENPADMVSRGVKLEDLPSCTNWWHGPTFLRDVEFDSTTASADVAEILTKDLPELRPKLAHSLVAETSSTNSIFPFHRFSLYNRMKRAAAYVLRFIHNTRHKHSRKSGNLSVDELRRADTMLARLSQLESFSSEYSEISNGKELKGKRNLAKLNLFIDNQGVLRVSGRLTNSREFSFDKKHPILISSKHLFSLLLFRNEHKQLKHAGPQALLYAVREAYWPLGGRNLARQIVHNCVTCRRFRGKTITPIMGNLPEERVTPAFPFFRCGVDYAGPFLILNRKGRGSKLVKCYICLFVCFVTRAVHLELVSDLSTNAYLLALKRFIARRGKPAEIFSDNGRNFVGLMAEFSKFLNNCSSHIIDYATSNDIKFKFIPPYSPHFGGLWEAGVKSCKHHLVRSLGKAHLTFEEFSTILTQIEAILNSRPLSPLSADPTDFLPLSPAHFLVGRPLTAPASEDLSDTPALRLDRFQRLEQIRQQFWTRWAKEYISELQTRTKWSRNQNTLQPNTLVVIKDDNTPPLHWPLGRIIATYPGRDGVTRVADIRTASGMARRAFPKICPLLDLDATSLEAGASKGGGMLRP